ncbi:glycerol-3-phosphate dehydrogenase [Litorivivens lipolytica]|uniref:Glycerol-3-phosphate dehydrogenase n=1 Tax=Litorivivens lipolytica TaxID=1524264 RepID=A0A7W4Z7X7_9GAMM|nr:FAD-dependent oxidoreductase [Litorivivens lipolytica]MBB3048361.1 glycerol-3-phosphate dehydrogenase [Litorivivens lipolytica]
MTDSRLRVDTIIIGGGVAGLWLLNRLVAEGRNAILFEQNDLGSSQTIASQGMIHGGIKYALGGALTGESEAIAAMPEHWARCLEGKGDVDISACNVLSRHFYLWSTRSLTSRLSSFFASKMLRGRVDSVKADDRPPAFDSSKFKGSLYRLADLVLDVPSLLHTLSARHSDRIFKIDWSEAQLQREGNRVAALRWNNGLSISADNFIFSAGAGNESLLAQVELQQPAMQRRPLQQVLVKHDFHSPLYAHCMGTNPSPRLTISSHRCSDGRSCWYLGGDLATEGVGMNSDALIDKARKELFELFPWVDFGRTEWATLVVDRAEPKQSQLIKPDKAYAERACDNLLVCWPTKLTLTPDMANQVGELLAPINTDNGIQAPTELQSLPRPEIATPCWETLF